MKRILTILVILTVSVSLMVSCSAKSDKASAETTTEKAVKNWPEQPINILVPAKAGGGSDIITRIITKYITQETGEAVVVTNVTGLSGYEQVRKQDPNGYNYVFGITGLLISAAQGQLDFGHEAFDAVFTPGMDSSNGILVRGDSPYKTLKDLFDAIEKDPEHVTGGISMTGYPYLCMLAIEDALDIDMYCIDAGNTSERSVALLGGQVDFIITGMAAITGYLESGDFRYLAITAAERNKFLPDVPTFKESGYDFAFVNQGGYLLAPKGTDPAILEKFNKLFHEKIQTNPDYQKEMSKFGMIDVKYTPDELTVELDHAAEVFQKYLQ